MTDFETEAELASAFMAHLTQLGWDCYPEVCVRTGQRADLVAVRGPLLWIVEAKLSLNASVCGQARGWINRAHVVSVLVPGRGRNRGVLQDYLSMLGIGVVTAYRYTYRKEAEIQFDDSVKPRLNRSAHREAKKIRARLHPDMKRYAPGTNAGFSSPWTRTMNEAVEFIRSHRGSTSKQIVAAIQHHYASDVIARACLLKWLEKDERVRVERVGRTVLFHAAESTELVQQQLVAAL